MPTLNTESCNTHSSENRPTHIRHITATMSSSLSFFLFLALFEMATGLTREYIYIKTDMSWPEAQSYCRKKYKDLATITTEEEKRRLVGSFVQGWIGLQRNESDSGMWQWSDGEPYFFNWNLGLINYVPSKNCIKLNSSGWSNDFCFIRYPFTCYRSVILVNENRTWEDALRYCRRHYTGLAFAGNVTNTNLVKMEAAEAQSVSVWMGLRFLDGKWFWLNTEKPRIPDLLPSCPTQDYRCGAHNTETRVWENRDCNEKLNFLCYWG